MSPEQALGSTIDRRSDVFAAGLLLWEAATGKRFWGELHDLEIIHALASGDFDPSPRAVDPSVPEALDAICCRALAPRAEDRYATANDLRDDLEAFLSQTMVNARRRLGTMVSGLFEKERGDVRAVIQRASRGSQASASMTLLLGSSNLHRAADSGVSAGLVSGISSIAPVQMDASASGVARAPGPARKAARNRWGVVIGASVFLTCSLVLAVELLPRTAALGGPSSRAASELASARTELTLASVDRKSTSEVIAVPVLTREITHVLPPRAPLPALAVVPAAGRASASESEGNATARLHETRGPPRKGDHRSG